jgi:hypothetical protein
MGCVSASFVIRRHEPASVDEDQCIAARKVEKRVSIGLFHIMSQALKSLANAERENPSPRITTLAWGRIEVKGIGTFRDAKVFPGGAREWDWNETGTAHQPGIQPADVAELLDQGATTIVLSQGMLNRLHVCPQTLRLLADRRVHTHVLPTQEAVTLYNRLRDQEQVAGLFHTTC